MILQKVLQDISIKAAHFPVFSLCFTPPRGKILWKNTDKICSVLNIDTDSFVKQCVIRNLLL